MSETTTKTKPSTEHAGSSCSTDKMKAGSEKGSCSTTQGSKGSCGG